MAVMLRLAADGLELLYVYRKHWGVSPDAPDNDSNVGADTMTVVWLCPASKQHLKGNKEWIELLKEKKKWIVMENNSSSCFYNYTAGWTADSCGIHSVFFHCFYSNKIGFLAEEWKDRHDFVCLFWLVAVWPGLSPRVWLAWEYN